MGKKKIIIDENNQIKIVNDKKKKKISEKDKMLLEEHKRSILFKLLEIINLIGSYFGGSTSDEIEFKYKWNNKNVKIKLSYLIEDDEEE